MKLSKMLFLFTLAIATVSCSSDDDGAEPYLLTNENIAGNYKTELLTAQMEQTFSVNNVPVPSTTNLIGDTFQVNTLFNADGTYSRLGQYRIVTTTNTTGQTATTNEIIVVDESGTYVINQTSNSLTLTQNGISQSFQVVLFNETKLNLSRDSSDPIGGVPTTASFRWNLVRK